MGEIPNAAIDRTRGSGPDALVVLYNTALPDVYGYLVSRCGSASLAEDLTSDVFMAAVAAVNSGGTQIRLLGGSSALSDECDVVLDVMRSNEVMAALGAQHRSALTLRYLDGLSVREEAGHLGRTIHATEALLVRARHAFRCLYGEDA